MDIKKIGSKVKEIGNYIITHKEKMKKNEGHASKLIG